MLDAFSISFILQFPLMSIKTEITVATKCMTFGRRIVVYILRHRIENTKLGPAVYMEAEDHITRKIQEGEQLFAVCFTCI